MSHDGSVRNDGTVAQRAPTSWLIGARLFWLGAILGTLVATVVLTATVLLSAWLERTDRIQMRAACARIGGEVVLGEDGTLRCVCREEGR